MAVAAEEQSRIGTTVASRYRLLRVLGRGGMGVVYEAEVVPSGRHVAIKVMHPENQIGSENALRFMNEARTAGRVRHPHVVEVLDAGQDPLDGSLFIVLELLTGIDLATYLERYEKLQTSEMLTVAAQVLQALMVAHREGIVHRDIKPENIFLARTSNGETTVKIVDFGISKAIDPEKHIALSITQSNTTVGTPHYMSPEQAKGETIDPRADIWALGVVMYECLTGMIPFDGDNYNTQILAVVTEAHLPATEYGVEKELSDLIDHALEKKRERRFGSAAEMLDGIRQYVAKHPDVAVRAESLLSDPPPEAAEKPAEKPAPAAPDAQPTSEFHSARFNDTVDKLPVFPGMVRIEDDGMADDRPTTVRSVRPLLHGRHIAPPNPATISPSARPVELPVRSAPPRRSWLARNQGVAVWFLLLGLCAASVGSALVLRQRRLNAAAAMQVQRSQVRVKFMGMPSGARAIINGVPYYTHQAYLRFSTAPARVRIEAEGFTPLEFDLVPNRNQDVALPPMSALAVTPTPAPVPAQPTVAPAPPPPAAVAAPPPRPVAPQMPTSIGPVTNTVAYLIGAAPRCRVSIDGVVVGDTPIYHAQMSLGPHRVTCERAGAPTITRQVVAVSTGEHRMMFDAH